jgi:molybdopterin synthase sulfur carrier subunit
MSVTVRIPQPLRRFTENRDVIELSAGTVGDVLEQLERQYPGITERLRDPDGQLRRFVNIYVDGEDIRFLSGLATEVRDGMEISIIPAIAGGSGRAL